MAFQRHQGGHPRRRARHPLPAGHQGAAQGDAAGRRQAGHPVRGGGGGAPPASTTSSSSPAATSAASRTTSTATSSSSTTCSAKGKHERARARSCELAELADIHYVRQGEPLGLGHAVSVARKHVGDEPFVVHAGRRHHGRRLHGAHRHDRRPRRARARRSSPSWRCPPRRSRAYGCAEVESSDDELCRITEIVEKPAARGRPVEPGGDGPLRVHARDLRQDRGASQPGVGGEIQLTDAIAAPARPRSRATATCSASGATTSARRSTTCGPPSSWPSSARTSARSSAPFLADVARRERPGLTVGDHCRSTRPAAHVLAGSRCLAPAVAVPLAEAARPASRPRRWPPPRPCRRSTTPRWTATPCGPPTSPARRRHATAAVAGTVAAGAAGPTSPVGPGEAVRIMTGAPVPDGCRRHRDGRATPSRRRATAHVRGRRRAGRRAGRPRPPGRRRPPRAGDVVVAAGHGADARPPRACWPRVGRRDGAWSPPAPGRGDVHRRRAGRRRLAAAPGPDPRLQPARCCWPCAPRRASTPSTWASCRDDEAAIEAALADGRRALRRASSPAAACRWATSTS